MTRRTSPTSIRTCETHGETDYALDSEGRWRCRKCRNERVKLRRRELKVKLVEYAGGACITCGYDKHVEVLEFHHTDPTKKDLKIARGTWGLERMKKEVDKCLLLCANCHREEHIRLKTIEHGELD